MLKSENKRREKKWKKNKRKMCNKTRKRRYYFIYEVPDGGDVVDRLAARM